MAYLGMPLFMGVTLPCGEWEFVANSRYYMELIGVWELALPSVTKCSLGTLDTLRIALLHWSYAFLH